MYLLFLCIIYTYNMYVYLCNISSKYIQYICSLILGLVNLAPPAIRRGMLSAEKEGGYMQEEESLNVCHITDFIKYVRLCCL